jgi:hypothetical protein
MNITFWFRPIAEEDGDLGEYARASGRVPVQVPTVTPDPMYVAVGERTIVDILASGRGTPIDDIYIGLHGRGVEINGTTGSDGIATMSVIPTSAGNISIDVGEEGRTVDTVLIATNWVLHISLPAQVDERDSFEITITEKASGDPVMGATVELQGVGTVTTDENGIATFTAPEVTSDRILEVTAMADGYAPEPGAEAKSIVVINKPKIYISIPSEITLDEAVTIQAGADDGNNNGILVTITGPGGTFTGTTVNGVVKIKVTKEEGTYTITAEKPDYESADPVTVTVKAPSPGFELLTLIIAIGVAYILLKRRRQH